MREEPHSGERGLDRLEGAARAAVERIRALEEALEGERRRSKRLERLFERLAGEDLDVSTLAGRLEALEAENEELRGRMAGARRGVERLLARVRFLEEQR